MTTPKPQHSPEPWTNDDTETLNAWAILDADDRAVASATRENRRRIVACVNALAGVPTEALESGALARVLDVATELDRHGFLDGEESKRLGDALRVLGRTP